MTAGDEALRAAKSADNRRNRAVHDVWAFTAGQPEVLSRIRAIKQHPGIEFNQHKLSFVHEIRDALVIARIRVQALSSEISEFQHQALMQSAPPDLRDDKWGSEWSMVPVVRGEFELDDTEAAGYRLLGPLPPRSPQSPS